MAAAGFEGWLTMAEAADKYVVKRDRLRRASLEGRLPTRKIGVGARMPLLVREADVERFLAESRKGPKPKAPPAAKATRARKRPGSAAAR